MNSNSTLARTEIFCAEYSIQIPILMAPMAGACPPELAIAVANGGGMGACGALLMQQGDISNWAKNVRSKTNGAFQMNMWIPDPEPTRNLDHEAEVKKFLEGLGPEFPADVVEKPLLDFDMQCEAMLSAGPAVISSIMGVYPESFVQNMKQRNIKWFATATTVNEAQEAEAAGADVIVAQGMEAGGHRGAFHADEAARSLVGLFSLLPTIVDAVNVPVVATGGIADGRGIAAALTLGASAVQIGTGLLRTPEAGISQVWADAIGNAKPEDTTATRAFSGRLGRSIATDYTKTAASKDAPDPAPYPIQRNLTQEMRTQAAKEGNIANMQAWAGQSASLAKTDPAAILVQELWEDARNYLK